MIEYYTDSARKSLWVASRISKISIAGGFPETATTLICFAAEKNSGYHIGQQVSNPKLENSNWQPLEGEIQISQILC
jgi:hypothetical protein